LNYYFFKELKAQIQSLKTEISSRTTSSIIKENCDEKVSAYKKSLLSMAENQEKSFAERLKLFIEDPTKKNDKESRIEVDVKKNLEEKLNETSSAQIKKTESLLKSVPVDSQKEAGPIINS
jgi:hypothetical protein